jgi:hypothetical protein
VVYGSPYLYLPLHERRIMVEGWTSQIVTAYVKHYKKAKRMEVWIKWESAYLPNTRLKVQTIVLQKKVVEINNDRCYNTNLKKLC